MTVPEFLVDPRRVLDREQDEMGIRLRARHGNAYGLYDISTLDRTSLIRWLRSEGGKNALAENLVLLLLGHHRLTVNDDAEIEGVKATLPSKLEK